ncbi:extracellular solute-binding protein [Actinomadura verrucosospora]|uniref:Carbohydrate ABC transporter substrate-binding protein n=1 Tax=Actinomadura verrucosospora TaxID=46165 RepID=A0A7D4AP50_ACTVE|nr:extracellular solute-binding protein [Actinomadura verrucosospora]QKG23108.1 carbohydrate ABC transporter substrate-binding protein [Actinomadura verrucosospora]
MRGGAGTARKAGSAPKAGTTLRAVLALALAGSGLAACGGGGTPTLNWYINPDNGGQDKLAAACSKASGGKYRIKTSLMPDDATQQREQLVRRLAAKDAGLDLMSLDPVFVAEAANAGFLRPFPAAQAAQFTQGVFPAAVESSMWKGKLYAAPFWANTQLLWYRKSVVQKAGVDPNAPDFTWDKMIDAALRTGTTVGVQGNKYEGYMVWINALVASAGGQVLSDAQKGDDARIDIDSPAGRAAATIIHRLAASKAASPTLSTDIEEQSRALFNGARGGFMVNWPYIWAADASDAKAGVIGKTIPSDIGWARYPKVTAGQESKPPFGGIEVAIGAYGRHKNTFAVDAVTCITSTEHQKEYMLAEGNPAARPAVYDDPEIKKQFPMAGLIRDSIDAATPRPITPYYTDVSGAIQSRWHPPASVDPNATPRESAKFVHQVLRDQRLL